MLVFENIVICFSFDYINNENGLFKSTLPPYLGAVLYCVQNYFFVSMLSVNQKYQKFVEERR